MSMTYPRDCKTALMKHVLPKLRSPTRFREAELRFELIVVLFEFVDSLRAFLLSGGPRFSTPLLKLLVLTVRLRVLGRSFR